MTSKLGIIHKLKIFVYNSYTYVERLNKSKILLQNLQKKENDVINYYLGYDPINQLCILSQKRTIAEGEIITQSPYIKCQTHSDFEKNICCNFEHYLHYNSDKMTHIDTNNHEISFTIKPNYLKTLVDTYILDSNYEFISDEKLIKNINKFAQQNNIQVILENSQIRQQRYILHCNSNPTTISKVILYNNSLFKTINIFKEIEENISNIKFHLIK